MAAARVLMSVTKPTSAEFADTYREWIEAVRDFQACTRPEDILKLIDALEAVCDHQPTLEETDAIELILSDSEDSGLGEFVFRVRQYFARIRVPIA